jgi:hypothetical protein
MAPTSCRRSLLSAKSKAQEAESYRYEPLALSPLLFAIIALQSSRYTKNEGYRGACLERCRGAPPILPLKNGVLE